MSGQDVLHVARDAYLDTVKRLVDDGYTMCIDLTGVDYLETARALVARRHRRRAVRGRRQPARHA